MLDPSVLERGTQLGILTVDIDGDEVTYHLGKEHTDRWSDPEEQVRAEQILDLVFTYKYSPSRMEAEVPIPTRGTPPRADIVVFSDDRRKNPYITVEVGAPSTSETRRSTKIEQMFGYANALASDFAMYYDTNTPATTWEVKGHGGLERDRNVIARVPVNYGNVPEYTYRQGGNNDLRGVDAHELSRMFGQCHNDLWSGGKLDPTEAFDEMSKLMFAKLYDEQRTRNGGDYGFQIGRFESEVTVAERIRGLYDAARERDEGVFDEPIKSDPRKIVRVTARLQGISLLKTDPDAKGRAYEQFLGEVFRGRLGQYFTRREIVDFMVDLAAPGLDDKLLDPACGSGGFLVYAMKYVFSDIENAYGGNDDMVYRLKREYAEQRIYGIEINEKLARVAMMDMVINDDGHTNIVADSGYRASFDNPGLVDGSFGLVLTNPPFGDTVKSEEGDKLGDSTLASYSLSRGGKNTKSEVLFVERATRFLKPGGRLGIVIPDGMLSNPTDVHVRRFLLSEYKIEAIVTLPGFAFRKAGSGMRTSILLMRKWTEAEAREQDYEIFMAIAEKIGYDSTARPTENELPVILDMYRTGSGGLDDKIQRVGRSRLGKSFRLDPVYYWLGPLVDQALRNMPYPVMRLSDIVDGEIHSGKSPKGGARYSVGSVPIILVGNIGSDGRLKWDDPCFVDEDFFLANRTKAGVEGGEILVAKDGATTGKVGMVPFDFDRPQCLVNEHVFRLRVGPVVDDEIVYEDVYEERTRVNTLYVYYFLRSWLGQMQVVREISGGAQGGITKAFVNNIRIPVPPYEVRQRFVSRSEELYERYIGAADRALGELKGFEDAVNEEVRGWRESGDRDRALEGMWAAAEIFRRV